MDLLSYLRIQARANRLSNHRLHGVIGQLSDADFRAPRTSFFPSLALMLEHIVAVDLYYLAALQGDADMRSQWELAPKGASSAALAESQRLADERFIAHAESLNAAALDDVVAMDRGEGRIQRELRGHVIAHLLAHQVHHRGQVHAMLSGTALKPPPLDEFLMPSEAHYRVDELQALGWTEALLFA